MLIKNGTLWVVSVCVLKRGLITFKHRLRVFERRVLLEEVSVI